MLEMLLARTRNRLRQLVEPSQKIFIIGPHRSATTTLHMFFRAHGLKSLHWRSGETFLAKEVEERVDDDASLKAFLDRWTVYSDFVYLTNEQYIENHTRFRQFERLYPTAYFLFNDRNVDRWVESRLRHRDGDWLTRYVNVTGATREQAIDTWRHDFEAHRRDVLEHFRGRPNFLHFNIDREDYPLLVEPTSIGALIDLVAPHFTLLESSWKSYNIDRRSGMRDSPRA